MGVVTWSGGRVSTRASISVGHAVAGAKLRDAYAEAVRELTFGVGRFIDNAVKIGPITLLRFGPPKLTRYAVDWPIEGGLLAGSKGGSWRVQSSRGIVEATVTAYRPLLPRALYSVSHQHVHQLFTRLYLLRLRGPDPPPGAITQEPDRFRAGTIDAALCVAIAGFTGRRRMRRALVIAAVYHVACWSILGRTFSGVVMRQRVVAWDGSKPTPAQALFRLALTPASWLTGRPVHDELAGTTVVTG
jgi:hypothetical protein